MFLYKKIYLKENVEVRDSLKVIYGVGKHKSFLVCAKVGFSYPFSVNNVNYYSFLLISSVLNGCTWLEVRIKRMVYQNIKILLNIGCYKGFRHRDRLPCRGQRTRTNARSCRRNK